MFIDTIEQIFAKSEMWFHKQWYNTLQFIYFLKYSRFIAVDTIFINDDVARLEIVGLIAKSAIPWTSAIINQSIIETIKM